MLDIFLQNMFYKYMYKKLAPEKKAFLRYTLLSNSLKLYSSWSPMIILSSRRA